MSATTIITNPAQSWCRATLLYNSNDIYHNCR